MYLCIYVFFFVVTTIGFRPVTYTASESDGQITFIFAVLDGTLGFTVIFQFLTANGTAFEGIDIDDIQITFCK